MAASPPFAGAGLIQKNCAGCHSFVRAPARLDLLNSLFEPADPDNFATWVKIVIAFCRRNAPWRPSHALRRIARQIRSMARAHSLLTSVPWPPSAAAPDFAASTRTNTRTASRPPEWFLGPDQIQAAARRRGLALQKVARRSMLPCSALPLHEPADYALRGHCGRNCSASPMTTRICAPGTSMRNFRPREGNTRTDR